MTLLNKTNSGKVAIFLLSLIVLSFLLVIAFYVLRYV